MLYIPVETSLSIFSAIANISICLIQVVSILINVPFNTNIFPYLFLLISSEIISTIGSIQKVKKLSVIFSISAISPLSNDGGILNACAALSNASFIRF